jgi:hypothetical protein
MPRQVLAEVLGEEHLEDAADERGAAGDVDRHQVLEHPDEPRVVLRGIEPVLVGVEPLTPVLGGWVIVPRDVLDVMCDANTGT